MFGFTLSLSYIIHHLTTQTYGPPWSSLNKPSSSPSITPLYKCLSQHKLSSLANWKKSHQVSLSNTIFSTFQLLTTYKMMYYVLVFLVVESGPGISRFLAFDTKSLKHGLTQVYKRSKTTVAETERYRFEKYTQSNSRALIVSKLPPMQLKRKRSQLLVSVVCVALCFH